MPNGELLGCCGTNYNMILVINAIFESQKQQEEIPKGIQRGFHTHAEKPPDQFQSSQTSNPQTIHGSKLKITLHLFSYWMNPFIIKP